ncbi:MAG: muconolactone Delta-isomerase family protein [Pseudomonadota bacterium]|nr:muconolactone Delta-isomerase family protein [Pseudomonadota bacterium]
MKFFVIGKRKEEIKPEQFAEFADLEAEMAIQLFREEFIRELYSIKGGKGACMIVEANDENEIREKLKELPFVKNNYLNIDIFEVKPYRGFMK